MLYQLELEAQSKLVGSGRPESRISGGQFPGSMFAQTFFVCV